VKVSELTLCYCEDVRVKEVVRHLTIVTQLAPRMPKNQRLASGEQTREESHDRD